MPRKLRQFRVGISRIVQGRALWHLLLPHHWPTWFFVGILWIIVRLPLKWQFAAGRFLGRKISFLAPSRSRVIRKNLMLAFPDMPEDEREDIARKTEESFGITLIETASAWLRDLQPLVDRTQFEGLDLLREAVAKKRGVVLIGAHFGSLEMVGAILSSKEKFVATHRTHRNPVVDYVCKRARSKHFDSVLEARRLIKVAYLLREGKIVWYAADQDMGHRKAACFVPFFGVRASTVTTPYRLAARTGAEALFMSHFRDEENMTWKVQLSRIDLKCREGRDKLEADAQQVNQLIENMVLEHIHQYFWVHRRYKSRSDGTTRDYSLT